MGGAGQMDEAVVERVLARLGLSRTPTVDLEGLRAIYESWCRHVPFDNLRKRIHVASGDAGPLPGDTCGDFFDAWLRHGTGGTCWAGNGALCDLLVSLGFNARRGIGAMLARPDLPPNHGTVIVELDGSEYLVDASILHGEPLLLDARRTTSVDHPVWGVRCAQREGLWFIHWRPLQFPDGIECRIDRLSADAEDFRIAHEQTRGWSPFNFEVHARCIRGESLVGVAMGERVEFDAGGVRQNRLSKAERTRVLIEELQFSEEIVGRLPEDVPMPPPPGSRTAAALAPE
jgi:N-hydroxyarylamine O-acetyltransferase